MKESIAQEEVVENTYLSNIRVKHYAPGENRTISTTLTNAEYHKFKVLGLKWNRLIRMGATLATSDYHLQTNKRLEILEKNAETYKKLYYELKREAIQKTLLQTEISKK